MQLDFISRLMWQAQLKGSKKWVLKPSPECEDICKAITFLVEPGDAGMILLLIELQINILSLLKYF